MAEIILQNSISTKVHKSIKYPCEVIQALPEFMWNGYVSISLDRKIELKDV